MLLAAIDIALLLSEWAGENTDGNGFACPVCEAEQIPGLEPTGAHKPNCEMDLSLAERGFPTQVERNAAREHARQK